MLLPNDPVNVSVFEDLRQRGRIVVTSGRDRHHTIRSYVSSDSSGN